MYICISIYVLLCMYTCIGVYAYTYTNIYIHVYFHGNPRGRIYSKLLCVCVHAHIYVASVKRLLKD